ncbi:MAG: type IX secretion system membrane protein PorP/SprF [Candidatus Delongbacteria bacterium]|jgi:type IX secretion system PorP/SprF family membrane protein|nr:type IX secretion system membrane protein PorP/SprF [Candidatus Delongbacteria bacterium]
MKKLSLLLIFTAFAGFVFSQQLPLYSQYMFNRMLLNPAVTGNTEGIPISLTARQQWVGIERAPSTQVLSAHTLLNNGTMGVGGMIFADRFGTENRIGFQGNYSYILPVFDDSKLSFGISFQLFQYQLDYTDMIAVDENDPAINEYSTETSWLPESDFGLYLYNEKYFAGLSANQMIELPVKIGGEEVELNRLARHYHLMGGYKFDLENDFEIEPSALVKGTFQTPFQFDINVRGIYMKDYWLGFSYRTDGNVVTMLGMRFQEFDFGLAVDFATSDIRSYQNGSYELFLRYTLQKTEGSYKRLN